MYEEKQGISTKNSEVLNNCINMWQYEQNLLEDCKKSIPKY